MPSRPRQHPHHLAHPDCLLIGSAMLVQSPSIPRAVCVPANSAAHMLSCYLLKYDALQPFSVPLFSSFVEGCTVGGPQCPSIIIYGIPFLQRVPSCLLATCTATGSFRGRRQGCDRHERMPRDSCTICLGSLHTCCPRARLYTQCSLAFSTGQAACNCAKQWNRMQQKSSWSTVINGSAITTTGPHDEHCLHYLPGTPDTVLSAWCTNAQAYIMRLRDLLKQCPQVTTAARELKHMVLIRVSQPRAFTVSPCLSLPHPVSNVHQCLFIRGRHHHNHMRSQTWHGACMSRGP